jgi:DNA-binding CsgD family transcriptional regulator
VAAAQVSNAKVYDPPPGAAESLDVSGLRQHIVTALSAMLDQVQRCDIATWVMEDAVSVMLEHDNVRCVLVVSPRIPRHALSPRELQIARLVAEGATNRAIASSLDISLWTVSTHMRRIFAKMDVCSRAEMVAQFFGSGERKYPDASAPTASVEVTQPGP